MNTCFFSEDRRYRYSLVHDLHPCLKPESKSWLAWIGLNPSTADEQTLDPTLRRIAAFTMANGYTGFVMLNLFAFRTPHPRVMMQTEDAVGSQNDATIFTVCQSAESVVCAWGTGGQYRARSFAVTLALHELGLRPLCLGVTKSGEPRHPLYVSGGTQLVPFLTLEQAAAGA